MKKNLPICLLFFLFCIGQSAQAQTAGDYKSVASGKWSSAANWQMFDGANWVNAVLPPSNLNGVITVTAGDSIAVTDTVYADQVVVQAGAKLNVTGRFVLMNGPGYDLVCNGNLLVQTASDFKSDTLIGGSTIEYKAAKLYVASGLSPEITFDGAVAQTIDGSGYLSILDINNPNNVTITGAPSINGINFISGKVLVTGVLLYGEFHAGFTGQGPNSFIDGPVLCIMYDKAPNILFDLPIGKGGHYSPLALTATQDDNQETELLVTLKDSAAPGYTLPAGLDKVSAVRYVKITRNNTTDNLTASLQLSYDSTDGVTDPANLRIAEGDTTGGANMWVNLGGTGSAVKNGTITTTVNFSKAGDFSLADASGGGNILPVHFISFTAAPVKQSVVLKWVTATNTDARYFAVERQFSAATWQTVGTVNATGNTATGIYTFTDAGVSAAGTYIYRIKEFDKDAGVYTSSQALVRMQGSGKMAVTALYPNPATSVVNYYVSAGNNDMVTVTVTAANGKRVLQQHFAANQALGLPVQNLVRGTYLVSFTDEATGEQTVKKFVKL